MSKATKRQTISQHVKEIMAVRRQVKDLGDKYFALCCMHDDLYRAAQGDSSNPRNAETANNHRIIADLYVELCGRLGYVGHRLADTNEIMKKLKPLLRPEPKASKPPEPTLTQGDIGLLVEETRPGTDLE